MKEAAFYNVDWLRRENGNDRRKSLKIHLKRTKRTKSAETSKDIHKKVSKNRKSKNIHQKNNLATQFGYRTLLCIYGIRNRVCKNKIAK